MAHPLRLALLWHMHQPLYRLDGENILPWTRLHATKDYHEMIAALRRHPKMRATINFVPSLLLQIRGYAEEGWTDEARELVRLDPESFRADDIDRLLYYCRLLPRVRMVDPFPRFAELIDRDKNDRSVPEIRDLQVFYLLCWFGEAARSELSLPALDRPDVTFPEGERLELLRLEKRLLTGLLPSLRATATEGDRIEFSTTPFYHPILPLLADLGNGERADPGVALPDTTTGWVEDLGHHLDGARRFHEEHFGLLPRGCWPSEGSVSDDSLEAIITAGFSWSASDETILRRTLGDQTPEMAHAFPWHFRSGSEHLTLLFRDHDLSDRIGFVYSSMDAVAAVDDFINGILERRSVILETYGETGVREAVLPIILDGENCWEYYEKNGTPFLDELYKRLVEHSLIEPVTFSEVSESLPSDYSRTLTTIAPGSWIGGNFRIWIGGDEENRAWELLAEARHSLMEKRDTIDAAAFHSAYEEFLAAEGSDWFWWFGEENSTENDMDFDRLFRRRLMNVYRKAGLPIPESLHHPIRHPESAAGRDDSIGTMHRATFDDT